MNQEELNVFDEYARYNDNYLEQVCRNRKMINDLIDLQLSGDFKKWTTDQQQEMKNQLRDLSKTIQVFAECL